MGLFSYKAIATGAAFRIATASVANVDFAEGTVIACAVVLTIGNTATDTLVYFTSIFVHHNKNPPLKVQVV
jgi:hypothetical protein